MTRNYNNKLNCVPDIEGAQTCMLPSILALKAFAATPLTEREMDFPSRHSVPGDISWDEISTKIARDHISPKSNHCYGSS